MSLFPKNQWDEWARQWGFIHVPTSSWRGGPEMVAGVRRGLLVLVMWRFGANQLTVRVRFPQVEDVQGLKVRMIGDTSLDPLPGGLRGRESMVVLTKAHGLMLRRPAFFLWSDQLHWMPGVDRESSAPTDIARWTDAIVDALLRTVTPFDMRCENCSAQEAQAVLVKEELKLLCSTCCQKSKGVIA